MALSVTDIQDLVARFSNKIMTKQLNVSSEILKTNALRKEQRKGVDVINVYASTNGSTRIISDNGTLPTGAQSVPKQGVAKPKAVISRLAIGRIAAGTNGGPDSVDQVEAQVNGAIAHCAKTVARAIFDSKIGNLAAAGAFTGTAVDSTMSGTFVDVSSILEGETFDLASGSLTRAVEVVSVTYQAVGTGSSDVAGQVVLKVVDTALVSTNVGTDAFLSLRGSTTLGVEDNSNTLTSYVRIGGSGLLHGLGAGDLSSWTGNTVVNFGGFDQEKLGKFAMKLRNRSGQDFSHVFSNPLVSMAYGVSALSPAAASVFGLGSSTTGEGARLQLGSDMDKYKSVSNSGLTFLGKPWIIDSNCPADKVILHNTEKVFLAQTSDFGMQEEGGDGMLLDRSNFSWDIQLSGLMELVCLQRNAIGVITGIGSL